MNKKELLKYAKLVDQEHAIREKLREAQKRLSTAFGKDVSWTEHHGNGVVLSISLAGLMAVEPDHKPTWHTFETSEGGEKGYFRYGPIHVGEIRPGFNAWVKHETQSVVTKESPAKVEVEAVKESGVAA